MKTLLYPLLLLVCLLMMPHIGKPQISLVKDINTTPKSTSNQNLRKNLFTGCNGLQYFIVDKQFNGEEELWQTDGTPDGTKMLAEMMNKSYNVKARRSQDIICYQNKIYFGKIANGRFELWAANESQPIAIVADSVNRSSYFNYPYAFQEHDGLLYFFVQTWDLLELWRTDGTAQGMERLFDLEKNGGTDIIVQETVSFKDGLYWTIDPNVYAYNENTQLWKYGLLDERFVKLIDGADMIEQLQPTDNLLYFNATLEGSYSLWQSDGTPQGTKPQMAYQMKYKSFQFGNEWVYTLEGYVTATSGSLYPGEYSLFQGDLRGGVVIGDTFYGLAYRYTGVSYQSSLFSYNGNGEEVNILEELPAHSTIETINNNSIIDINGELLLFPYDTSSYIPGLGVYDLTTGTLTQITDSSGYKVSEPHSWAKLGNDKAVFFAESPYGVELYVTDGTSQGTYLLKDTHPGTKDAVFPNGPDIKVVDNKLFFLAGYTLWQSEGSSENTLPIFDFSDETSFIGQKESELFYQNRDSLYAVDARSGVVRGIVQTPQDVIYRKTFTNDYIDVAQYTLGEQVIYHLEMYDTQGKYITERWVTDGTSEGTHILPEVGGKPNAAHRYVIAGDKMVMLDWTDQQKALWVSDGTQGGAQKILDISLQDQALEKPRLVAWDNKAFLFALSTSGVALWVTDGSTEGTHNLSELMPSDKYYIPQFTPGGLGVYFLNWDELWRTDGTPEGTSVVTQIRDSTFVEIAYNKGRLIMYHGPFRYGDRTSLNAYDERSGKLWESDIPFEPQRSFGGFSTANGILHIEHNDEIWRTDGTLPGTNRVAKTVSPSFPVYRNGELFFFDYTEEYGRELYKTPFTKLNQTIAYSEIDDRSIDEGPFESDILATSGLPVQLEIGNGRVEWKNNVITPVKPGRAVLSFKQPGNAVYNRAPAVEVFFCINPAQPIISLVEGNSHILQATSGEDTQWLSMLQGQLVNTGTTFKPDKSGIYQAYVKSKDGYCNSKLSEPFEFVFTGIGKDEYGQLAIWPNPASEKIYLSGDWVQQGNVAITIAGLNGRAIETHRLPYSSASPLEVSTAQLANGVYLLQIESPEGRVTRKFIKQ